MIFDIFDCYSVLAVNLPTCQIRFSFAEQWDSSIAMPVHPAFRLFSTCWSTAARKTSSVTRLRLGLDFAHAITFTPWALEFFLFLFAEATTESALHCQSDNGRGIIQTIRANIADFSSTLAAVLGQDILAAPAGIFIFFKHRICEFIVVYSKL